MGNIYMPSRAQRKIPPPGMHRGVCYVMAELGTLLTSYEPKPQLLMVFELLETVSSSGKPYELARRYTLTSDPMGKLRQDLESWLGRALTDEALARIDLSQL